MSMVLRQIVLLLILGLAASPSLADNAKPMYVFQGDGVKLVVQSVSDDSVTGQLERNGQMFPFTATLKTGNGKESLNGTFTANGQPFPFNASRDEDGKELTFSTGTKTMKLTLEAAPNPLDDGSTVATPTPSPAPDGSRAGGEQLKLKRVGFNDINMDNVLAYTMLIPDGWQAQGHIEWSQGGAITPQQKITVSSPTGARLMFIPGIEYSGMVNSPQWIAQMRQMGIDQPAVQGVLPPEQLGQFLANAVQQNNPNHSNLQLISDAPDQAMQETVARIRQAMNIPAQESAQVEFRLITMEYDQEGRRMREVASVIYTCLPPNDTGNSKLYLWNLNFAYIVTAPAESFEKDKPLLLAVANTLQPTAKWWTQSQAALVDIIRLRGEAATRAIRERARQYEAMTAQDKQRFDTFSSTRSDAQRDRIQGIYETQDYTDRDGTRVPLSIHYKHTFSDGNGNIVQTNTYEKPGAGYEEIHPFK